MFKQVKDAILRDMKTASEAKYADKPCDALIQHFLLLETCERLERMQRSFADLAITLQLMHVPVQIADRDASWPDDLSMIYCANCKAWHHPSAPHKPTRPDQEASSGTLRALHSEDSTGDAGRSADTEEAITVVDASDAAAAGESMDSGRDDAG